MKHHFSIISTVIFAMFFTGCGKRFTDIEVPNSTANQMALFAEFDANDPSNTYVYLTKINGAGQFITWNFNRNSILSIDTSKGGSVVKNDGGIVFDTVPGAEVKLYRNDTLVATLQKSKTGPAGIFKTGKLEPMSANSIYKIVATAPNFETLESTQKVQTSVVPDSVYFSGVDYLDKRGDLYKEVIIEFKDPPNEINNYEIFVTTVDVFQGYERSIFDFQFNEPNKIVYATIGEKYFILPDKDFNGQTYKIKIGVSRFYISSAKQGFNFYFKAGNKNFEDFIKAKILFKNAEGNPFVEPYQPYSNVKNGFGFFLISGQRSKNFLKI